MLWCLPKSYAEACRATGRFHVRESRRRQLECHVAVRSDRGRRASLEANRLSPTRTGRAIPCRRLVGRAAVGSGPWMVTRPRARRSAGSAPSRISRDRTHSSGFVELFADIGASKVRDRFKETKDAVPCIFIDEHDAQRQRRTRAGVEPAARRDRRSLGQPEYHPDDTAPEPRKRIRTRPPSRAPIATPGAAVEYASQCDELHT